jgi:hypothetical protein
MLSTRKQKKNKQKAKSKKQKAKSKKQKAKSKKQKAKSKKQKVKNPSQALACDFFPSFNPINPLPGRTLLCREWRRWLDFRTTWESALGSGVG